MTLLNLSIRKKILAKAKNPYFSIADTVKSPAGYCWACGETHVWVQSKVIDETLAHTWEISEKIRGSFDARESMACPNCNCSFRLRAIARTLTEIYGGRSLFELTKSKKFRKLKIAEVNSCGKLHQFFEKLPNLSYSEYGSKDSKIPSENLEKLSYPDESFDLILTSDTLEHIPNIEKAMTETYRILKPGGIHVFTVPVVWSRKTRKRAELTPRGKLIHILEPSYHGSGQPDYLVFNEFGYDILDTIEAYGFIARVARVNILNLDDTNGVMIASKVN